MQRGGLRKLLQPVEPGDAVAGLNAYKTDCDDEVDHQREDLRAHQGPADALDGGIATPELRAPPERACGTELG